MADLTANPPRGVLSAMRGEAPSWGSLPGAARAGGVAARAAEFRSSRSAGRMPPPVTADDVLADDDGPDWGAEFAADPVFGSTAASAALAEFNAAQGRPLAAARMGLFVGGGVLSLALVGLVGVWGYKVVLREVLGVPVVAAEAGPMRVEPVDPGGRITADIGLAVNAVAADGAAAPPSDVLTLAPQTADLAPEDLDVAQTDAEAGEVEPQPTESAAQADAAAANPVPSTAAAEMEALVDRLAAGATPMAPLAEGAAPPVTTELVAPATETLSADVPGVTVALRPPARPMGRVEGVTLTSAPEPAPEPSSVALTEAVPSGTSLIQLGAYDSPEVAAAEWDRLQGPFGEFLGGKQRVIQEAVSGGHTFFRLRAMGFDDLADARRLCAALAAEDAGCIPVVTQ